MIQYYAFPERYQQKVVMFEHNFQQSNYTLEMVDWWRLQWIIKKLINLPQPPLSSLHCNYK